MNTTKTYTTEAHVYRLLTSKGVTYMVNDYAQRWLFDSREFWEIKAWASHYNCYLHCHFHRYDYAQGAQVAAGKPLRQYPETTLYSALSGGRGFIR